MVIQPASNENLGGNIESPVRGKQRTAVYNALEMPISGRQILEKVRLTAPSMTYQDLRHILRNFEKHGIAVCLNPLNRTGRYYVRASALTETLIPHDQLQLCALVGRAKTRLTLLKEIARQQPHSDTPLTASEIKRQLRDRSPLSLNHVLSALKFLTEHHLVEIVGQTNQRNMKIYGITNLGITILSHLQASEHQSSFGNNPTR